MSSTVTKIENTADVLEQANKTFDPRYLRPYLELDNVFLESKKAGFFAFFRYMLRTTKKITEGKLQLKIRPSEDSETSNYYELYDDIQLDPKITVVVEQPQQGIHLDILPF